jgi:hypothetical protein
MKFKILTFLILSNFVFAYYDDPALLPFLSSSKPYYLEKLGVLDFFSKEKFKFNVECAGGKFIYLDKYSLVPFPSFSGYFKFKYKNFGFSITIFDRYQYIFRSKTWAADEFGQIYEITYYDLNFIYSTRMVFSYVPIQKIIFNLTGDINYGFRKCKFEGAPFDTSVTYQDYSFSYSLGILYFKNQKTNFYLQYDSRVRIKYEESRNLFIPSQITTCLNFPFSKNLNIGIKNFIKYDKFKSHKSEQNLIKTFDMAFDFLTSPIIKNTSFYFSIYTFPFIYYSSLKVVGFMFGPKFHNFFVKQIFIMFERGRERVEGYRVKSLTRYGIILNFSF